jgi:AraC-like DNA-binding protein
MLYTEIKPSNLLSAYVRKYWFLEGFSECPGLNIERILPDGCTELIIHYADPFKKINGPEQLVQETAFLFGQLDRFIDLLPGKKIGVMGVRFHPWGLSQFINQPAGNIRGEAVSLMDLFEKAQKELMARILEAQDTNEKAAIMDKFLMRNLKNKINNTKLSSIINLIRQQHGSISINELTKITGSSERQLERSFYSEIGLSPKAFCRIVRFQQTLHLVQNARSLTDLALSAGYYDQAHFTREFTEIAGESPRNFFRREIGMNGLFLEA